MTPEQYANDVVESMGMEKGGMPHLLALKIKKAINAAVQAEREAWEKECEANAPTSMCAIAIQEVLYRMRPRCTSPASACNESATKSSSKIENNG